MAVKTDVPYTPQGGERLQVRMEARAAAGIRSRHGHGSGHSLHASTLRLEILPSSSLDILSRPERDLATPRLFLVPVNVPWDQAFPFQIVSARRRMISWSNLTLRPTTRILRRFMRFFSRRSPFVLGSFIIRCSVDLLETRHLSACQVSICPMDARSLKEPDGPGVDVQHDHLFGPDRTNRRMRRGRAV